jgi:hypothetical protein
MPESWPQPPNSTRTSRSSSRLLTGRKGELATAGLKRELCHHVAPAEKVRGLVNAEFVRGFAATSSAAPLTYPMG